MDYLKLLANLIKCNSDELMKEHKNEITNETRKIEIIGEMKAMYFVMFMINEITQDKTIIICDDCKNKNKN